MCRPHIHPCFYCGLKLPSLGEVRTHVKQKHKDVNFACAFFKCGAYFWTDTDKNSHMTEQHGAINIQCNFCSKTFLRNINLREHIALMHPTELALKCPERNCLTFATGASDLDDHLTIFHDRSAKRVFNCFYCKVSTKDKRGLMFHFLNTHLPKTLKCPLCPKKCVMSVDLKKHHNEKHLNHRTVACIHCRKEVEQRRMRFHAVILTCKKCKEKISCHGLLHPHKLNCNNNK
jgi:hypothetical protein